MTGPVIWLTGLPSAGKTTVARGVHSRLAARGDSVIHNIGQIERGYEQIDTRLRALGAQIERIDDGGMGGKGGKEATT